MLQCIVGDVPQKGEEMYLKYLLLLVFLALCFSCNKPAEPASKGTSDVLVPISGSDAETEIKGIMLFGFDRINLGSAISEVNLGMFPDYSEERLTDRVYAVYKSDRVIMPDLPLFDKMSVDMRNKLTNTVVSSRSSTCDVFTHFVVGLEFYDDKLDTIHIGFQTPTETTAGDITDFVQEMRQAIKSYYDPRLIVLDKFYGDEGYDLQPYEGALMLVDRANDLNNLMFVWTKTSAYIDIHYGPTFSSRVLLEEKLKKLEESGE